MRQWVLICACIAFIFCGQTASAEMEMQHGNSAHKEHGADHSSMKHETSSGTYEHKMVVDGIRAEFQVMSLESMNMKDPEGNTHHIMVKFFHDKMDHQLKELAGKIKVISPSKKEQTSSLKNYGGIYAANFTFDENGKWGVICLFKTDGEKHIAKFWYPHQ